MNLDFSVTEPSFLSGEGREITIFLMPFRVGEVRNWRCVNCGKLNFQYQSDIGLVVDAPVSPLETGPTYHKCARCGLMHRVLW